MIITGAQFTISPRIVLGMTNAAALGGGRFGTKLRSESTVREVWRVTSLVLRRNFFRLLRSKFQWVSVFADAESLRCVKYNIYGLHVVMAGYCVQYPIGVTKVGLSSTGLAL